jgi:ceramide glucosyltransferase
LAFLAGWRVLRDRQVLRWWWMIPVRDCVGFMVWLAGFAGHKIHWRGEVFELRKGKLLKIEQ